MINPTGKKLEKLLFGIFDNAIEGADRYNHNGSLWLIFTDEMRWVVEYTKDQTLWYNFYFFRNEMEIIGLDCVDNKYLIRKWFESRFFNINSVEDTKYGNSSALNLVKDTIQNGVKHCEDGDRLDGDERFEDIIQNGVKHTQGNVHPYVAEVKDTIQNGVKKMIESTFYRISRINDVKQNCIKEK